MGDQKHRLHGLALDSEYRQRWQFYHLADGSIKDSRLIHWRQVDWENVVKVESFIRGKKYTVDCTDPRFQFFIVFRWFGQEHIDGNRKQINIWTQGWSDGSTCYLTNIDFKTGQLLRQYKDPLSKYEAHVHPRVKGKMWKNRAKKKQHFGNFM